MVATGENVLLSCTWKLWQFASLSRYVPHNTVMAKNFKDLSEREILALAIALEEEDGKIYGDFVDGLRETYPASAKLFREMQEEESDHRARLLDLYGAKFGEHIPHIRREDVKGFVERRPVWLMRPLGLHVVRKQAEIMELETRRFYERAAQQASDVSIRKLLGDLAQAERKHSAMAESLEERLLTPAAREEEDVAERRLRAPNCAAWFGGPDGRFSLNACARIRGGVRDQEQLGCVSGGNGGFCWSGYIHGLCGGSLR